MSDPAHPSEDARPAHPQRDVTIAVVPCWPDVAITRVLVRGYSLVSDSSVYALMDKPPTDGRVEVLATLRIEGRKVSIDTTCLLEPSK